MARWMLEMGKAEVQKESRAEKGPSGVQVGLCSKTLVGVVRKKPHRLDGAAAWSRQVKTESQRTDAIDYCTLQTIEQRCG